MKTEDKIAVVIGAFTPWLMILIFHSAFNAEPLNTKGLPEIAAYDPWRQAIFFVGAIWAMISPFLTMYMVYIVRTAKNK